MVCTAVLLTGGFYGEENWRGKRAWERCKRDLERRGAQLNWAELNGAPVPDSENFFKAPKMMDWLGGGPNREIAEKLSLGDLTASAGRKNTNAIAEVKLVSPETSIGPEEADLVLSYDGTLSMADAASCTATSAAGPVGIPLIVMDRVPLTDAIRNLARQADLQYKIDPRTGLDDTANQPMVSARWSDLTPRQALTVLLSNHGLQLVKGPPGCKMRIVRADQTRAAGPGVQPDVRAKLTQLLCSVCERGGNHLTLRAFTGSQNLGLFARPLNPMDPVRIVVRTDESLSNKEVARFFSGLQFTHLSQDEVTAERVQDAHYKICLGPPIYYTAEDYLAWSDDHIGPELEAIRRALERPYAWIENESRRTADFRVSNFVAVRLLAQTLGQRAQCHILLDQPEEALRELELLHGLHRIMTRKPLTLVGAMMNVAVTGVYVQVVADGLRLGVWQGPQLAEIQRQLETVNLVECVVAAFQCERLTQLRAFESGRLGKIMVETKSAFPPATPELFHRLKLASYRLLDFVPKGWMCRNMATLAALEQEYLDAAEPGRGVILPRGIDAAAEHSQSVLQERKAATFIAGIVSPIFTRAWQVTAQTQASVRQAMTACALQRYHIMKGVYPVDLSALIPELVKEVALDPVTGERMQYRSDSRSDFLLYSVGWNGIDEGGKVCYAQGGGTDPVNGDWVWGARELR